MDGTGWDCSEAQNFVERIHSNRADVLLQDVQDALLRPLVRQVLILRHVYARRAVRNRRGIPRSRTPEQAPHARDRVFLLAARYALRQWLLRPGGWQLLVRGPDRD